VFLASQPVAALGASEIVITTITPSSPVTTLLTTRLLTTLLLATLLLATLLFALLLSLLRSGLLPARLLPALLPAALLLAAVTAILALLPHGITHLFAKLLKAIESTFGLARPALSALRHLISSLPQLVTQMLQPLRHGGFPLILMRAESTPDCLGAILHLQPQLVLLHVSKRFAHPARSVALRTGHVAGGRLHVAL
jgi:hypothetical protein